MEEYWDSDAQSDQGIFLPQSEIQPDPKSSLERLDMLLPTDEQTSAATYYAFRCYLGAMMEMTERYHHPLSLICIGVDESAAVKFLGSEGASLISRAITRYLRQETRSHDVVGRSKEVDSQGYPYFLIACPLLNEVKAGSLATRIVDDIMAQALDPERPWLSLSVGVAGMSIDVSDPDGLAVRALASLKRARRSGGKRVWLHSATARSVFGDEENIDKPGVD